MKVDCMASHSMSRRGSTLLGVSLPTDNARVSAAPLILSMSHPFKGIADVPLCLFRNLVVSSTNSYLDLRPLVLLKSMSESDLLAPLDLLIRSGFALCDRLFFDRLVSSTR